LDEAMAATLPSEPGQSPRRPITFDEANAAYEATGQVGFRADQKPGQEFIPGSYNTGGAPRQPKLYEAPQPAPSGNLGAAIKDSFAADEGTRLRLIAEELFPGDPGGINRVGIRNGKPVFVNDEGKLQYVSGTKSKILGSLIGAAPEIIGGIAGSFAGSPLLGSTAGATAGRALKRGISNLVFDEPVTPKSLATELAVEAGTNLVGGAVGKGVAKIADRGRSLAFSTRDLAQAEAVRQGIKQRTGIDLDLAQASGDRSLIALRDFAARYPGKSAELLQAQDEIASGQFDLATRRVLDLVGQPTPATTAGQRAINAAEEVISGTRRQISAEVQPFYDAAYASKTVITNPRIKSLAKLPEVASAIAESRKILNLRAGRLVPEDQQPFSLQLLDETKKQLDDDITKLRASGDRNKASAIAGVRDEIRGFLDNVSRTDIAGPGEPQQIISLYKQARQEYAKRVEARLAPLENGLVGTLARLEPQSAATAANIFQGTARPEQVALLKASLSRQDPEAYSGLVRSYLDDAYSKAQTITQGGDQVNVPGKFLKILAPNPGQRDTLKAILPAGAYPVLEDVLQAAEKLAATPLGASRISNSNTFRDGQVSEVLKGRGAAVARALTTPRQAIREAAELKAQEKGVVDLTEALIDPTKREKLRSIVKMKDETKQLILLGSIFGAQGAVGEVQDLNENAGLGQ
jgi:hypothetical protein